MTRDDVIRMATEAGMQANASKEAVKALSTSVPVQWLERFAALVAAAEREACARLAEAEQYGEPANEYQDGCDNACKAIAKSIRAMGQA